MSVYVRPIHMCAWEWRSKEQNSERLTSLCVLRWRWEWVSLCVYVIAQQQHKQYKLSIEFSLYIKQKLSKENDIGAFNIIFSGESKNNKRRLGKCAVKSRISWKTHLLTVSKMYFSVFCRLKKHQKNWTHTHDQCICANKFDTVYQCSCEHVYVCASFRIQTFTLTYMPLCVNIGTYTHGRRQNEFSTVE